MKKSTLLLITVLMAICLARVATGQKSESQPVSKPVFAIPQRVLAEYKEAQQGDVQIHLNGGKDQAIIGTTNTLEIWIANGAPLIGMSLGFEIRSQAAFRWLQPYGNAPVKNPLIKEEEDVAGKFDFGGLKVKRAEEPGATVDSFMIGGATSDLRFPKHKQSTLCYSLQFRIPASEKPTPGGFCVDNIFFPPAGSWTLHDTEGFQPTFQGRPNTSAGKPDAAPVCFDVVKGTGKL
ncbi:MAG: hypothetical protein NT028_13260 [candidate division Zixibacteria bacterium]|nr:hypothetical protein [candidate division Zixibacteria bacterium]